MYGVRRFDDLLSDVIFVWSLRKLNSGGGNVYSGKEVLTLGKAYPGPLHAPSLCGAWHNGHGHFVVFYLCPDYWTILDPLDKNYTPLPP